MFGSGYDRACVLKQTVIVEFVFIDDLGGIRVGTVKMHHKRNIQLSTHFQNPYSR